MKHAKNMYCFATRLAVGLTAGVQLLMAVPPVHKANGGLLRFYGVALRLICVVVIVLSVAGCSSVREYSRWRNESRGEAATAVNESEMRKQWVSIPQEDRDRAAAAILRANATLEPPSSIQLERESGLVTLTSATGWERDSFFLVAAGRIDVKLSKIETTDGTTVDTYTVCAAARYGYAVNILMSGSGQRGRGTVWRITNDVNHAKMSYVAATLAEAIGWSRTVGAPPNRN